MISPAQPSDDRVAWSVTLHDPPRPRPWLRHAHHSPFPPISGLLARSLTGTPRFRRTRYLFSSAAQAQSFIAALYGSATRTQTFAAEMYGSAAQAPDFAADIYGAAVVRRIVDEPFDRPVIIVSPPRSGGTMLFDALAAHPEVYALPGESEAVIEGVPALHPAARGYVSHALTAADAVAAGQVVRWGFYADLPERGGNLLKPGGILPERGGDLIENTPRTRRALVEGAAEDVPRPPGVPRLAEGMATGRLRLVEKTPENCLRLPFLLAVLPGAYVVFLRRDPKETVASMVATWRDPRFVNIPELPGWSRGAWHLLLPPGWRDLDGADLATVAAHQWSAAVEAVLDARSLVPAERWIEVDYADLLRRPGRVLAALYERLGLSARTVPIDFPLSATTITPPVSGKWRRTAGFRPDALDAHESTVRRLAAERLGDRGAPPAEGESMKSAISGDRPDEERS